MRVRVRAGVRENVFSSKCGRILFLWKRVLEHTFKSKFETWLYVKF